MLLILPLCLAPGTFFDVDVFRNIKWKYNSATDTGLQIFIQDLKKIDDNSFRKVFKATDVNEEQLCYKY